MKKMNKKGFTLVEIMIVVAIIGLLAAIGVPSIVSAFTSAQTKTKERNVTDVEKAKAMQTLPTEVGGLNKTEGDAADDATLLKTLNIDSIDKLIVGGSAISVNAIGTKASY